MPTKRFADDIVAAITKSMILGIRAGTEPHRIIGIWAVVVERRVFVRSWSMKPRSWYRTFLEEPRGIIQAGDDVIPVRAVRTRSDGPSLNAALAQTGMLLAAFSALLATGLLIALA